MLVRRVVAAFVVCSVLVALAGCAEGEPEPKMPEPTSSASSPTPVETSDEPEQESAEDFIRRWVEVGDQMQVTGSVAEYAAITPKCDACQAFVRNVEQVYARGGFAEFAGSEFVRITRAGAEPPTFDVTKRLPKTVIHHGDSRQPQVLAAGTTTLRVTLNQADGVWTVTHFGIL